jgi:hypothetical protein
MPVLLSRFAQVDRGLGGLPLGEQDPVLPPGVVPVLQQPARGWGDVGVAAQPPQLDALSDVVDEVVGLDPVERPLVVELQLRAALFGALLT